MVISRIKMDHNLRMARINRAEINKMVNKDKADHRVKEVVNKDKMDHRDKEVARDLDNRVKDQDKAEVLVVARELPRHEKSAPERYPR